MLLTDKQSKELTDEQFHLALWVQKWKDQTDIERLAFLENVYSFDDQDWYYPGISWDRRDWEDMDDYHTALGFDHYEDDYISCQCNLCCPPVEKHIAVESDPYDFWDYQEEFLDDKKHEKRSYSPY